MSRLWTRCLHPLLILGLLWNAVPVAGAGSDYALLGQLALPWACGEGHRITWDPKSHWTFGNSRGLAFDLSMVEGTAILAPADGQARFLIDDKPYASNLGHYIDLAIEGGWRIRLAHLRDAQLGQRAVRRGELLGYSGSSGATAAHLHMEIIKPAGQWWDESELGHIESLFGLPFAAWVENAVILNENCPPLIALGGQVHPVGIPAVLGDPADLVVPLHNIGQEVATVRTIQLVLEGDEGESLLFEQSGTWVIGPGAQVDVVVRAWPNAAGGWRAVRVTSIGDGLSQSVPAEGVWSVEPSPLKLVGLSGAAVYPVGGRIILDAWVENTGSQDVMLGGLRLQGTQPDGSPWEAGAEQVRMIPAGGLARVAVQSTVFPQAVGVWGVQRIGYIRDERVFFFGHVDRSFSVWGPELVVKDISAYAAAGRLNVFVLLKNEGTDTASPDVLELWGWEPDGERAFVMRSNLVAPLRPGQATLARMELPLRNVAGSWRLVEAGHWSHGQYYRLKLPAQPAVSVSDAPRERQP